MTPASLPSVCSLLRVWRLHVLWRLPGLLGGPGLQESVQSGRGADPGYSDDHDDDDDDDDDDNEMIIMMIINDAGTMMVGQVTAFGPNYNRAILAATRIFTMLDR